MANLRSLPFDILRLIVWDEEPTGDDVACLRLTCKEFNSAAASRLFYRISLSKLKSDRDAFLSICHAPVLAAHVREVEWLEVSWDLIYFDRMALKLNSDQHAHSRNCLPDDRPDAMCAYIHDESAEGILVG